VAVRPRRRNIFVNGWIERFGVAIVLFGPVRRHSRNDLIPVRRSRTWAFVPNLLRADLLDISGIYIRLWCGPVRVLGNISWRARLDCCAGGLAAGQNLEWGPNSSWRYYRWPGWLSAAKRDARIVFAKIRARPVLGLGTDLAQYGGGRRRSRRYLGGISFGEGIAA
jgi:hypothetical protein